MIDRTIYKILFIIGLVVAVIACQEIVPTRVDVYVHLIPEDDLTVVYDIDNELYDQAIFPEKEE